MTTTTTTHKDPHRADGKVDGNTIGEMFANRAAATPNAPAFMSKRAGQWQTMSWQEAYERASDIAHGLLALGCKPGDKVAILGSTREEWTLTDLGLMLAGGVTVPIYPSSLKDSVGYILRDSEAVWVFAEDQKQLQKLLSLRSELPTVKQVILWLGTGEQSPETENWVMPLRELTDKGRAHRLAQPHALTELRRGLLGSDIATIIYTSGTTGRPKGVMLTHRNLMTMGLTYFVDVDPVASQDAIVYAAPMSHGAGIYAIPHLMAGARHIVPASGGVEPAELFGLAKAAGPLSMFAAPTIVKRLVDHAEAHGESSEGFKTIVYGGAPMYAADIERAVRA